MQEKIDISESSWNKEQFLNDIHNTRNLILDLLCAIHDYSGVCSNIGDAIRFLDDLERESMTE